MVIGYQLANNLLEFLFFFHPRENFVECRAALENFAISSKGHSGIIKKALTIERETKFLLALTVVAMRNFCYIQNVADTPCQLV